MTKTGVADLKARLSEYLREVRAGGEVEVFDRDQPIARIVPYGGVAKPLAVREPVTRYGSLESIPLPPPLALPVDAVDLLLEERRRER